MCGRFSITLPNDAMAQLFDAAPANALPDVPNYNVCPTNDVHVVLSEGGRRLQAMRWGFLPHWYKALNDGPLLINARAETLSEKPAFRAACRERRYIFAADGGPLVFAGVWQAWEREGQSLRTCAIVTCPTNTAISRLHHRMPVVLDPGDWGKWLGEEGHGAAVLMKPAPDEALELYRVGTEVNSNRAKGPQLIQPA
jgi:putative SOS response-associated peptidase YedK